jgi:hypothetical protein
MHMTSFLLAHVLIQLMKKKRKKIRLTSSILDFDVGRVPAVSMTIPESDVGTLF